MKISYAVTVADEIKEIQTLLPLLVTNKLENDEILALVTDTIKEVLKFDPDVNTYEDVKEKLEKKKEYIYQLGSCLSTTSCTSQNVFNKNRLNILLRMEYA